MVEWHAIPKSLSGRLKQIHTEIMELVIETKSPHVIKEYFGLDWADLSNHAHHVVERLQGFVELNAENGKPSEQTLRTFFEIGFLTGVQYANSDDHEPNDN